MATEDKTATPGEVKSVKITTGGKGMHGITINSCPSLNGSSEYLSKTAELLGRTFAEDAVICFLLSSLSEQRRLEYVPTFMHALAKASALSNGIFQEAKVIDRLYEVLASSPLTCRQ